MITRKQIIALCILLTVCILTVRTDHKISESEIREIAYQYMSDHMKMTVTDWKDAKVEEDKTLSGGYLVSSHTDVMNLKDTDTYRVTFRTNDGSASGPIVVFVDQFSFSVVGVGLRD